MVVKKYFHITLILAVVLSCAKKQVKKPEKKDPLRAFFEQCENDIKNAKKVIIEKDIIKNLNHLQFMNSGGKKYYLLERENISKMISAVTEGIYDDFVLIHKNGKILYTRKNDEIFGKNVRTALSETPFNTCYINRNAGVFFVDNAELNEYPGARFLMVSDKVKGGETIPGIFILQLDINKIKTVIPSGSEVINSSGIYIVSDSNISGTKYGSFDKINQGNGPGTKDAFRDLKGRKKYFKKLSYRNISWILIAENEL